jgi:hypothetical protein
MKSMELALTTLTAPRTAFLELRERPSFWLPLTLTLVGTAAVLFWYYSIVDIAWASCPRTSANEPWHP